MKMNKIIIIICVLLSLIGSLTIINAENNEIPTVEDDTLHFTM
ncbi:hypothetical protein [Methanosphaera sp. BMS]|nr:hypothetical protein [Methanosphaera sp. BMS]